MIQLKTKEQFESVVGDKWKNKTWMWNTFKDKTCYIPSENVFISLERGIELGYKLM